MIALLPPPIGIYVDHARCSARQRLRGLAVTLAVFPLSYGLLLMPGVPPLLSMLLLGSGWAFSNCLFWSTSTAAIPAELLSLGSGILGSALNLGATALPYAMGQLNDGMALGLLLIVAAGATVSAAATAAAGGEEAES
mmetsp:Transcript_102215/g.284720  ORF Transcript_102215/g.284720 Transcript_102215/m.284720 type:complete len:138 (-) Transcript_102215:67-480(-)